MRYPQQIPGNTNSNFCPICNRRKYHAARICAQCDPVFQSRSKSFAWADAKAVGPCMLVYRQMGYQYVLWTPVEKAVAA